MSYNAADGAALVAAAVQAAIHGGAPRRTVAAVAAAVAGTVLSAAAAPRQPATKPQVHSQDAQNDALEADSPEQLLASLRAARRAQRLRKKQRRREAKQAAGPPQSHNEDVVTSTVPAEVPSTEGAAGQRTEHVGALVAAPAQAPERAQAPDSRKDKQIGTDDDASDTASMQLGIHLDANLTLRPLIMHRLGCHHGPGCVIVLKVDPTPLGPST